MFAWLHRFPWFTQRGDQPVLNGRRLVIHYKGSTRHLQHKAWKVLDHLRRKAPGVVSRRELIDTLWPNQWSTGEKGLNHAIWCIRKALHDDPQAPEFIRTVPREGYQWIGTADRRSPVTARASLATAVGALLLSVSASPTRNGVQQPGLTTPDSPANPAVSAFLEHDRIVIDLESGCRGYLVASEGKRFGSPVLSVDGQHVAFTVHEAASCKTVTLDVIDYSHQEFEACPVGFQDAG